MVQDFFHQQYGFWGGTRTFPLYISGFQSAPKNGGPNRLEGSVATNTSEDLGGRRHLGGWEMSQGNFLGPYKVGP